MTCSVCICIVGTNDGHAWLWWPTKIHRHLILSILKPDFLLNLTDSLHALTTHSGESIVLPLAHMRTRDNNYSFLIS